MAVNLPEINDFFPIDGISLSSAKAGIRYQGRDDLSLVELSVGSTCAAVFTTNSFAAAPVIIARRHLALTNPRFWLINSGNANSATGEVGILDALQTCQLVADTASIPIEQVIPYSTGIIGERLPITQDNNPFSRIIPQLYTDLAADNWGNVARAIMTTDTEAKGVSIQVPYQDSHFTISGVVKGSGMIHPNMATMLAFIATDIAANKRSLQSYLQDAVDTSFHRISVDGDCSTNDSISLAATGKASLPSIDNDVHLGKLFAQQLANLCSSLAQAVIRDAEGASRFVTIRVNGAYNQDQANSIAKTIALSPLVKTAIFAGDPNWGRIICALGYANAGTICPNKIDLTINDLPIVRSGILYQKYSEEKGIKAFAHHDIDICIDLHLGEANGYCHSCDLGHEYVKINAEYRS